MGFFPRLSLANTFPPYSTKSSMSSTFSTLAAWWSAVSWSFAAFTFAPLGKEGDGMPHLSHIFQIFIFIVLTSEATKHVILFQRVLKTLIVRALVPLQIHSGYHQLSTTQDQMYL